MKTMFAFERCSEESSFPCIKELCELRRTLKGTALEPNIPNIFVEKFSCVKECPMFDTMAFLLEEADLELLKLKKSGQLPPNKLTKFKY